MVIAKSKKRVGEWREGGENADIWQINHRLKEKGLEPEVESKIGKKSPRQNPLNWGLL